MRLCILIILKLVQEYIERMGKRIPFLKIYAGRMLPCSLIMILQFFLQPLMTGPVRLSQRPSH